MAKETKKDRIKAWLKKDDTLTNSQLRELIGVSDHMIWNVRKEIQVPCPAATGAQQIGHAYRKFMKDKRVGKHPWSYQKDPV